MEHIAYPIKLTEVRGFDGGLNTKDSPFLLKPNQFPYIKNFDLSEIGTLSTRPGSALFVNVSSSGGQFLDNFYTTNNPEQLIAVAGGVLYAVDIPTKVVTTLLTGLSTTAFYSGTPMSNDYFVTNDIDGLIHITFSSGGVIEATKISSSPIGGIITYDHQGRLFLSGNSTLPNRIYFSAFGNGTDWTTEFDAGYYDLAGNGLSDGDVVKSLVEVGGILYAGRNHGIKKITGTDPFQFNATDMPSNYGMVAHNANKMVDNWMYFLTADVGVWAFQFFYPQDESTNIQPNFTAEGTQYYPGIDTSRLEWAAAVKDKHQYRLSLSASGSSYNNIQLIYSTITKSWTYYDNQTIAMYAHNHDLSVLYAIDSTNGNIYTLNTGVEDNGVAYNASFVSAPFDGEASYSDKVFLWGILYVQNTGNQTVAVNYIIDMGKQNLAATFVGSQGSVNEWGTTTAQGTLQWGTSTTNTQDLWMSPFLQSSKFLMAAKGRQIQVEFNVTGVTSEIVILGYDLAMVVLLPN